FQMEAASLRDTAKTGNKAATDAVVKDFGRKACGSCHTPFRVPPPPAPSKGSALGRGPSRPPPLLEFERRSRGASIPMTTRADPQVLVERMLGGGRLALGRV